MQHSSRFQQAPSGAEAARACPGLPGQARVRLGLPESAGRRGLGPVTANARAGPSY